MVKGKRYQVYSIKNVEGRAATWIRAGSAWVNRDGSINVYLDVLPIDGKLHIRELKKDQKEENAPPEIPEWDVKGDGEAPF